MLGKTDVPMGTRVDALKIKSPLPEATPCTVFLQKASDQLFLAETTSRACDEPEETPLPTEEGGQGLHFLCG